MVFLDYQNAYLVGHSRFQPVRPRARSHVDPQRIGALLVGRRRWSSELTGVRVYRGRPSPALQPVAAAAFDRQAKAWAAKGISLTSRLLRYPSGWPSSPAEEKGVDVALAVDFVRLAMEGAYDVGILFSSDSDLLPALETVSDLRLARVEVAAWSKAFRLRFPDSSRPWCHHLSLADYQSVLDPTDYSKPAPQTTIGEAASSDDLIVVS
jgi:uncharacterized LabA/DUF88 family protein